MASKRLKRALTQATVAVSVLAVLVVVFAIRRRAQPSAVEESAWLGDWLGRNEPIVREYLLNLGPDDVGQPCQGLELTDGTKLFVGDVFLGRIDELPKGVYGFSFQRDTVKFACLWAERGGPTLRLPTCADPNGLEHEIISRDVYTYGDLLPGGRIVFVWCPPVEWVASEQNTPHTLHR